MFGNKSVDVIAIYRSPDLEVSDPDFKAEVDETLAGSRRGPTTSVATYWDTRDPSMVSTDKHATTVTISLAGEGQAEQSDLNDELVPTLEADDLETEIAGPWAVYKGVNETVSEDLARAELFSLPLVVILSLLIFGSVVAALMPAVVGAISVLGAMAVVRLITELHRGLGVLHQRDHPARHRPRDRLRAVRDQPVPRGAGPAARRTTRRRPRRRSG